MVADVAGSGHRQDLIAASALPAPHSTCFCSACIKSNLKASPVAREIQDPRRLAEDAFDSESGSPRKSGAGIRATKEQASNVVEVEVAALLCGEWISESATIDSGKIISVCCGNKKMC